MTIPGRMPHRALGVALAMSLVLHAAILVFVSPIDPFAELDVELAVPTEIEFGVSEGMIETPAPETPANVAPPEPPPATEAASTESEGEPEEGEGARDAGVDASVADAGVDAGDAAVDASDAEVDASEDAEIADAGVDAGELDAGDAGESDAGDAGGEDAAVVAEARDAGRATTPAPTSLEGPSSLAPGAQIALRLDLDRVRASALAPAVARLLEGIPDFHLLLDGSGIDVMRDLDRLYMATPDPFDRSRFVYAGRHLHDEAWAREAVARMAIAHGETAAWTRQRGVWVAPWHANDGNPRIIALLGPHHFVVCRAEDLRAVLAYMNVRLERGPDGHRQTSTTGADALFTLGDGEALGIEVEGLRRYVRRATIPMPETARVAIRQEEDGRVLANVRAAFADAETAQAGQEFWDRQRENVARSSFIRFTAFGPTIAETRLVQENEFVTTQATLSASQTEALLALVQANVANLYRMRPQPATPPSGP